MMQKNTITVTSDKITQPLTFAFAADFHNGDADEALSLMRGCDAILIGGDLVNRHSRHGWRNAARFLDLAPRVAPTFYNLGNHERLLPDIAEYLPLVQKSGTDPFWAFPQRNPCQNCFSVALRLQAVRPLYYFPAGNSAFAKSDCALERCLSRICPYRF